MFITFVVTMVIFMANILISILMTATEEFKQIHMSDLDSHEYIEFLQEAFYRVFGMYSCRSRKRKKRGNYSLIAIIIVILLMIFLCMYQYTVTLITSGMCFLHRPQLQYLNPDMEASMEFTIKPDGHKNRINGIGKTKLYKLHVKE